MLPELTWDDVPMLIPEMASMVSYAAGEVEPTVHSFRMVTAAGLAMQAHWWAVGQVVGDGDVEMPEPATQPAILKAVVDAFDARLQNLFLYGSPDP